jgi:rare lipoprotein A (peptidoglycan hydrolase)
MEKRSRDNRIVWLWLFTGVRTCSQLMPTLPILRHRRMQRDSTSLASAAHYLSPAAILAMFTMCLAGCGSLQSHHVSSATGYESRAAVRGVRKHETARGKPLGSTDIVAASWYGPGYEGHRTSSGERFDPNALTAASNTLPLGSKIRVTNPRNGHSTEVRVNDRGPAAKGRSIDLSPAAAQKIGLMKRGVARVEVTPVSYP